MSNKEVLSCVEIDPDGKPAAAVVWLHGLGASGHDFEPIVPELGLDSLSVRFVFPHAPEMPVTLNGGMVMPAWYDMYDLADPSHVDWDTVAQSDEHVRALIQREMDSGIAADRIVLAGFSQGGAIALQTGLRFGEKLAGILALSTYLLDPELQGVDQSNGSTSIFMAHGMMDPVIPHEGGKASCKALKEKGYPVQWREYPMMHAVCPQEIRHIADWFRRVLA